MSAPDTSGIRLRFKTNGLRVKLHAAGPHLPVAWMMLLQILHCYESPVYAKVTSVSDGEHGGRSLHYVGRAFDFKVGRDPEVAAIDPMLQSEVTELLKRFVGDDWDVINKGNHVHTEWDPKEGPR